MRLARQQQAQAFGMALMRAMLQSTFGGGGLRVTMRVIYGRSRAQVNRNCASCAAVLVRQSY